MSRTIIVCGAGATHCEAANKPEFKRPPLDRGFFRISKRARCSELDSIIEYLKTNYSIDPTVEPTDSLEGVMRVIYSDIFSPATDGSGAAAAFRDLLRLINRRIADTTNSISPSKLSSLYRLIRNEIIRGVTPADISLITFNYDLNIERTLAALSKSGNLANYYPVVDFPHCYHLSNYKTSKPTSNTTTFRSISDTGGGVDVLKLHGSLNWFSKHLSKEPKPKALLSPERKLWVTNRASIMLAMTMRGARRLYTYPVVVPPVTHKAAILHRSLISVWERAQEVLKDATKVIIYGYSAPSTDTESVNLLARSLRGSQILEKAIVINPSVEALQRIVEATGLDAVQYFRSARAYLHFLKKRC